MTAAAAPIGEDDLQAWVDGRLDAERRRQVDSWLSARPEEVVRLRAYARERDALRAALAHVPVEPIPARLRPRHVREALRRRRRAVLRTLLSVLLLVSSGAVLGWFARDLGRVPEAAAPQPNPDRAWPVEVLAGDASQMAARLSDRVGEPVAVPELSLLGFRPLRAWALPGAEVLVVYADPEDRRLSLFRRRAAEGEAPAGLRCLDRPGGVRTYHWSDPRHAFAVTGVLDAERLREAALFTARWLRLPAGEAPAGTALVEDCAG